MFPKILPPNIWIHHYLWTCFRCIQVHHMKICSQVMPLSLVYSIIFRRCIPFWILWFVLTLIFIEEIFFYERVICRHDSDIILSHGYLTRFINARLQFPRQTQKESREWRIHFTCKRYFGLSNSESNDLKSEFKCNAPANSHSYSTNALACRCSVPYLVRSCSLRLSRTFT